MNEQFLTDKQLAKLGLASYGSDVLIHHSAVIPAPAQLRLGSRIRIDPFCVLSASDIHIGDNVHIASNASLSGGQRIELNDFVGLSAGVRVFSSNDDYSGKALLGPTVPAEFRLVAQQPVIFGKHVTVGSGSVVLPGTEIGTGSVVGALSLVKGVLDEWGIYSGVPARRRKDRSQEILEVEQRYLASFGPGAAG